MSVGETGNQGLFYVPLDVEKPFVSNPSPPFAPTFSLPPSVHPGIPPLLCERSHFSRPLATPCLVGGEVPRSACRRGPSPPTRRLRGGEAAAHEPVRFFVAGPPLGVVAAAVGHGEQPGRVSLRGISAYRRRVSGGIPGS